MVEDQIEGAARQGVGRVQDAVGGLVGDERTQARGKLNEAAGSLQNAYGKVKDQAQDAIGQVKDRAGDTYDEVEAYVREQPLTALGIAVGVGLVLGLLLHGGRRTVYVRR